MARGKRLKSIAVAVHASTLPGADDPARSLQKLLPIRAELWISVPPILASELHQDVDRSTQPSEVLGIHSAGERDIIERSIDESVSKTESISGYPTDASDASPVDLKPDPVALALKKLPARWCVALMVDAVGLPVQLLCAKNLRASLARRFVESDQTPTPSRRIDYRQIVSAVWAARVTSELEMDLVYQHVAKLVFPDRWKTLVPQRLAYFVHVDPCATHPDFSIVESISEQGKVIGPFSSSNKALTFIHDIRDAFDLCRYHNLLRQSPHGAACVYKQMGKCPAPCDGSIPLDEYRYSVSKAVRSIVDPVTFDNEQIQAMQRLAAQLEFEQAARVNASSKLISALRKSELGQLGRASSFEYVVVTPGPRKSTAKVWRVGVNYVEESLGLIAPDTDCLSMLKAIPAPSVQVDDQSVSAHVGSMCHHLRATKSACVWISLRDLSRATLDKAVRQAMAIDEPEVTDESVLRESSS